MVEGAPYFFKLAEHGKTLVAERREEIVVKAVDDHLIKTMKSVRQIVSPQAKELFKAEVGVAREAGVQRLGVEVKALLGIEAARVEKAEADFRARVNREGAVEEKKNEEKLGVAIPTRVTGLSEEIQAGEDPRPLSPVVSEGKDEAEKVKPKYPPPPKEKRKSSRLFTDFRRHLSWGPNQSPGQSPSSANAKFAPMLGVSVEEAIRLMRESADVIQIGSLMFTHFSVRTVQLAGFEALGRVWAIFASASASSPAASSSPSSTTSSMYEVAECYIAAVVGGMRAHLEDLEVQQKGVAALKNLGQDKAFDEAMKHAGGVDAVMAAMKRHPSIFGGRLEIGGAVLERASLSRFEEMNYSSGLQIFTGLGRRLSWDKSSGSSGPSPFSADSKFAPMWGMSVEEAMRLMRESADVLQIGSLMLTHASEREVQLAGFEALGRVLAASPVSSASPSAPSSWAVEVAEGYIEAVVRCMRAHLDDVEVQQKGVSALQDLGQNKAFERALKDTGGVDAVMAAMTRHPASFGEGMEVGGVELKRASLSRFEEMTYKSSSPTVRVMGRRLSDAMHFSKQLQGSQGD
jgi:hypothetical protein